MVRVHWFENSIHCNQWISNPFYLGSTLQMSNRTRLTISHNPSSHGACFHAPKAWMI
jgi:hypothetical protein